MGVVLRASSKNFCDVYDRLWDGIGKRIGDGNLNPPPPI